MQKEPKAPTVLVVEDEWLVREAIADRLKEAGCEVVEAPDGETALSLLEKRDGFDVLFTDIRLGGALNGWDVAEAFREAHPELPVIYTSGAPVLPKRQVPGSLYFDKPYQPEKIVRICRDLAAGGGD